MHETVTNHDAIGNDIEAMYNILSKDFECRVYANNGLNTHVKYVTYAELIKAISDPNTWIIYHHSVYWRVGYRILKQAKCRIIFRYHNITPAEFFKDYNDFHYMQCSKGRKETEMFIKVFPDAYWISDSIYNSEDLIGVDRSRKYICPPFHSIEKWSKSKPDEGILRQLIETHCVNLLFVSRVAPNKGHLQLVDVLKEYRNIYSSNVKLRVIGKFDEGLPKYNDEVKKAISDNDLSNNIEFIGEVNDSTLLSYYLGSDVYVSMSEHEGFSVPIIESQFFELPIVAKKTSAIPETIGEGQMIFNGTSRDFAIAIHEIVSNYSTCKYLKRQGKENYKSRFAYSEITKEFTKSLRDIGVKQL